jgi:uncharacterized protein (TIGR02186 family)
MRQLYIGFWIVLLATGLLFFGRSTSAPAAEFEATIEVSPDTIAIDSFYHGERLMLRGMLPAGCEPVLVLKGENKEHSLRRKGRVGPLWMNIGDVNVKNAPELYYLLTAAENLEAVAPAATLSDHGIGYDALREVIAIEQDDAQNSSMFGEFIKFKEKMGFYRSLTGAIDVEPEGENKVRYSATVAIPAKVPPGTYEAQVYCFGSRLLISHSAKTFVVKKVGLTKWLTTLAFTHAALYGILAILVAMAAGLLMGLLFGSKKKEPH